METYFANTFSAGGIYTAVPDLKADYHILAVKGNPGSAVTIFLQDILNDLHMHDISVETYLSCVYPETPDLLIIPSLKRIIVNANNLSHLLADKTLVQELDISLFCHQKLLNHYSNAIDGLRKKIDYHKKQGFHYLRKLEKKENKMGQVTRDMLLMLQSIFPLTAENKGSPRKFLASSITSSGWISKLQSMTSDFKKRYIIKGSPTFLRTFFNLVDRKAHNLNMNCHLIINSLEPNEIEGIIFTNEKLAILRHNPHHHLICSKNDITLSFKEDEGQLEDQSYRRNLKRGIEYFIKTHSYREELDEYYWYSLDLDKFLSQRQRVIHQLLSLCGGKELWEYFS